MATTKMIHNYTAATGIDGAADLLLIDPGSTGNYNSISRNVLLGVTGTPADVSTSQAFTNKTIGNTNNATLKDGSFTLQNSSSTTKQAQFSLASITAGNTRTYTLPDITDTLVTLTATQTITNKTLTSPTINSPTITNASITADSISGYTVSNSGNIYGIAVSLGTIGSAALAANAVTSTALATGAVTASKIGTDSSFAWTAYTPTWTNLTAGNGTNNSKYYQIGKMVHYRIDFTFGSTTSISGSVSVSLPVTAVSYNSSELYGLMLYSQTGTAEFVGSAEVTNTTTALIYANNASGTYLTMSPLSSTVPFTWASTHRISGLIIYEAA